MLPEQVLKHCLLTSEQPLKPTWSPTELCKKHHRVWDVVLVTYPVCSLLITAGYLDNMT